jgi:hypothetical protein
MDRYRRQGYRTGWCLFVSEVAFPLFGRPSRSSPRMRTIYSGPDKQNPTSVLNPKTPRFVRHNPPAAAIAGCERDGHSAPRRGRRRLGGLLPGDHSRHLRPAPPSAPSACPFLRPRRCPRHRLPRRRELARRLGGRRGQPLLPVRGKTDTSLSTRYFVSSCLCSLSPTKCVSVSHA